MRKHYTLYISLFICSISTAQTAPEIEWQNTIGGLTVDNLTSMQETSDGGYILGGYSDSEISPDKTESSHLQDYWVVKTDKNGVIQWQNTIGGDGYDYLVDIKQTAEGGYVVGGTSSSLAGIDKSEASIANDCWIIKLDAIGNILWENTIIGNSWDYLRSLSNTEDGGYIIAIESISGIGGDKTENYLSIGNADYWIIKLDNNGDIEWQNTIGGLSYDAPSLIEQTSDGGYIVGGISGSGIGGDKTVSSFGNLDMWIIKLTESGLISWQKTIGGSDNDYVRSIHQTADKGYIIAGDSKSGISGSKTEPCLGLTDYWILKLDSLGNIVWQNTIGGNSNDITDDVIETVDGGYLVGGSSMSGISGDKTESNYAPSYDFWILKLNSTGIIQWQNTIKGGAWDWVNCIQQTSDNGYVIGGSSSSNYEGDKMDPNKGPIGVDDYWVIKLYPDLLPCSIEPAITASDTIIYCESVMLSATDDPSYTYQWKRNGINITGETASTYTTNVPGIYTAYISNGDCYIISASIIITANNFPEIEWQNTIGGNGEEYIGKIEQTSDGGYVVAAGSSSNISGDKTENSKGSTDYWILKLNSAGTIDWQKTIGGSAGENIKNVSVTADGGYIICGFTTSGVSGNKTEPNIGGFDYWIVKLSSAGEIEWQKTIGGNLADYAVQVIQDVEGGYIAGGYSKSNISGNKTENSHGEDDIWLIKLSEDGLIEWQKTIGGNSYDYLSDMAQTEDGGYIIGGSSSSAISGDKTEENIDGSFDYWILKLNNHGEIEWQNTIGGNLEDILSCISQTSDGGYIIGGVSESGISADKTEGSFSGYIAGDYWVVKINNTGNIEWQKTYGGMYYDALTDIKQTSDGKYIICGYSESRLSGNKSENVISEDDYWIIKINEVGFIEWQNVIGALYDDHAYTIDVTADGGYIVGGTSSSNIYGDKSENTNGHYDIWIVKVEDEHTIYADITPSGSTSFCTGENVTLNAPVDASYTYQWKKNGVNITGATSSSFTANNTGQYQVYISNGTCDDISDSISVVKNPKPNPNINNLDATNDLCFDTSIKLKTAAGAGYSYQWYKGAALLTGATSNIYFATLSGNYKVKVTNSFGCSKTSASYSIIKTCKLGEDQTANDISVNIYPNPNNGKFTLQLSNSANEILIISINNLIGEKIYTGEISTAELNHTISLDKNIPDGIYVITIQNGTKAFSQQIVITK